MIITEFIKLKNHEGKNIVACYDYKKENKYPTNFIVIPPSYGESKLDSLSLAYFLAENNFHVLRYDGTHHIGESDGEIFDFTLLKAEEDLVSVLDFIQKRFSIKKFGLLAKSLAGRIAIRLATKDRRIKCVVCIGGIVNLQKTLKNVYQEDIVDVVMRKKYMDWKFADILGFEISRNFLESAIRNNLHDFAGTIEDFRKISIPFTYLLAERDVWVDREDVETLLVKSNRNIDYFIIPHVLHQINENPKAATYAFRKTVVNFKKYLLNKEIKIGEVLEPDTRETAPQFRLEKQRLKKYELTKEEEKKFWQKYLTTYILINKSEDYREYLDFMDKLLDSTNNRKEALLDAGCGFGHFGAWIFSKIKQKNRPIDLIYVGVDFLYNALRKVNMQHRKILRKFSPKDKKDNIKLFYICEDFELLKNSIAPFKDNVFDKICCSLLISYIKEPFLLLRELNRILKPGGRIVVTSLKPYADLSQIYRNFIDASTRTLIEIKEARKLLSSAGKIKQKESEGHYKFFNEEELKIIMENSRFKEIKIHRSFGDQANVAVATKE